MIDYLMSKYHECNICKRWRYYQQKKEINLDIQVLDERNVENDINIFLTVYEIPSYDYVKQFLKISNTKYEMIDRILWMVLYHQKEGEVVKENIKQFVEGKQFNIQNTVLLS